MRSSGLKVFGLGFRGLGFRLFGQIGGLPQYTAVCQIGAPTRGYLDP